MQKIRDTILTVASEKWPFCAWGPGRFLADVALSRQPSVEADRFEQIELDLKGKSDPMRVAVIPVK